MNKKTITKTIVSLVLISLLIYAVDFNSFINEIKKTRLLFLIIGLSFSIPGILLSTYKWQILLQAHGIQQVGFWHLWRLYYIGMFFSNFLPTEVGGDVIRSYNVGKASGRQAEAFAAVTMERMTGLVAMVIYSFAGIFLNWSFATRLGLIQIGLLGLAIMMVALFLLFHKGFARWAKRKLEIGPVKKMIDKLKGFYLSLADYSKKPSLMANAMILSVVFQFLAIASVHFLLLAIDISVSFSMLILIVPMVSLISIIPISINGIGLREGAFVFLFSQIGVAPSESFAVSIFYRIASLLPSLFGGGIYLFGDGIAEKNLKRHLPNTGR